jgi:DNA-directed RNA polymerase specialized sigma24 family protein
LDESTDVRRRLTASRRGPITGAPAPAGGEPLEALYRAFFLRLVRRATWRYGLSKEDAREVVHDAFVLALIKLDPNRNPASWLYGVVDRLAANWKRKEIRHANLLARWAVPSGAQQPNADEEGD